MTTLILPTESLEAEFADIFAGTIKRAPVTNKTLVIMLTASRSRRAIPSMPTPVAAMTLAASWGRPFRTHCGQHRVTAQVEQHP